MAERIYYYAESLSRTTTTSIDITSVKTSVSFLPSAGKDYAIFWSAFLDQTDVTGSILAQLWNATTGVVLENCRVAVPTADVDKIAIGGIAFHSGGTAPVNQTIAIRYASEYADESISIQEARIIVLELGANDKFVESIGETQTAISTYSPKCTLAFTPPSAGDYLIIGHHTSAMTDSADAKSRLYDGSTAYELTKICYWLNSDVVPVNIMARAVGISAPQTWTLDYAFLAGTGNAVISFARILALRLGDFQEPAASKYYWGEDRTAHTTTTTTYADSVSVGPYTPDATEHLIVASGIVKSSDSFVQTTTLGNKITISDVDVGSLFAQQSADATYFRTWWAIAKSTEVSDATTWKTQYNRASGSVTMTSDEHVLAVMQIGSTAITATEIVFPFQIASYYNLIPIVEDLQDVPDSPNVNWLFASNAAATTSILMNFLPSPSVPYGQQVFRTLLRKTAGTPTPTVVIELCQSGFIRKTLASSLPIDSVDGVIFESNWNSSDLVSVLDGSDVQLNLVSSPGLTADPGALPAHVSAGTLTSTTGLGGTDDISVPSHLAGDLLVLHVLCRTDDQNGSLLNITTSGWTQAGGASCTYGGTQAARMGFGWKIGNGSETLVRISTGGGSTQVRLLARVFKFTAANGFDQANPVANVSAETAGSGTAVSMPSVTASATNQLAVTLIGTARNNSVGASTGESGGNWIEPVAESSATNGTIDIQTASLATGGEVTGGTSTLNLTTSWVAVGFTLVPADLGGGSPVNTVEVGGTEWICRYEVPPYDPVPPNLMPFAPNF